MPCSSAMHDTHAQPSQNAHCLQARASSTRQQQVYVMRHGERQDMAEAGWATSAERPWDPPLSAFGVTQAAQRGASFAANGIPVDTVVASPFTRCVQTAAGFMRAYGLPADRLHVDARVCEWMSSRNLGLSHVTPEVRALMRGDGALWFWGAQREAGLQAAIAAAWSHEAAQQVLLDRRQVPLHVDCHHTVQSGHGHAALMHDVHLRLPHIVVAAARLKRRFACDLVFEAARSASVPAAARPACPSAAVMSRTMGMCR